MEKKFNGNGNGNGSDDWDFEIEDGIPVPEQGERKYPFAKLKIGQSFAYPYKRIAENQQSRYEALISKVQNGASKAGKELGWKFKTKAFKSSGILRIWRIA